MSIKYTLENHHLAGGDTFRARVRPTYSVDLEGIVDLIVRQGSTVTRADILSVLEGLQVAVAHVLLDGGRVNLPLANFCASIRGVFEEGNLEFDPACHQVVGSISQGKLLKAILCSRARVERVRSRRAMPTLLVYTDCDTGEQNGRVTPGGMAKLVGEWLKFEADDPQQGVFYVAGDGARTRVPVVGHNKPSLLMFVAPAGLAPGDYTLTVQAAFDGDLRSGTLDATLTV